MSHSVSSHMILVSIKGCSYLFTSTDMFQQIFDNTHFSSPPQSGLQTDHRLKKPPAMWKAEPTQPRNSGVPRSNLLKWNFSTLTLTCNNYIFYDNALGLFVLFFKLAGATLMFAFKSFNLLQSIKVRIEVLDWDKLCINSISSHGQNTWKKIMLKTKKTYFDQASYRVAVYLIYFI